MYCLKSFISNFKKEHHSKSSFSFSIRFRSNELVVVKERYSVSLKGRPGHVTQLPGLPTVLWVSDSVKTQSEYQCGRIPNNRWDISDTSKVLKAVCPWECQPLF